MSTITRKRGDNYPIGFNFKVNGVAVDLSGAVIKFSFKNIKTDETTTVTGSPDAEVLGRGIFTPTALEMSVAGQYLYDFQRDVSGVIYTHKSGDMLLEDDVTK